jgi:hypothetical protein
VTAEQVCDDLLVHFGYATDDDVALAVIRADVYSVPAEVPGA